MIYKKDKNYIRDKYKKRLGFNSNYNVVKNIIESSIKTGKRYIIKKNKIYSIEEYKDRYMTKKQIVSKFGKDFFDFIRVQAFTPKILLTQLNYRCPEIKAIKSLDLTKQSVQEDIGIIKFLKEEALYNDKEKKQLTFKQICQIEKKSFSYATLENLIIRNLGDKYGWFYLLKAYTLTTESEKTLINLLEDSAVYAFGENIRNFQLTKIKEDQIKILLKEIDLEEGQIFTQSQLLKNLNVKHLDNLVKDKYGSHTNRIAPRWYRKYQNKKQKRRFSKEEQPFIESENYDLIDTRGYRNRRDGSWYW